MIKERCEIIAKAISLYKSYEWFDIGDLRYFVKVLLENGIVCISEDAYSQNSERKDLWKPNIAKSFISNVADSSIQNMISRKKQTEYLQERINRSVYSWEHIVPTDVLVDLLLEFDKKGDLTDAIIERMINDYGYVCVITKAENTLLDSNKLRSNMPNSWVFGKDAFDRYKSVGIKVK